MLAITFICLSYVLFSIIVGMMALMDDRAKTTVNTTISIGDLFTYWLLGLLPLMNICFLIYMLYHWYATVPSRMFSVKIEA